MEMFCYQCEQASKGTGCVTVSVCGKSKEAAILQDVIIYALKGIGVYGHALRSEHYINKDIDVFTLEALFTTVTNVNFDEDRLEAIVRKAYEVKETLKSEYEKTKSSEGLPEVVNFKPAADRNELLIQGQKMGVLSDFTDPDIRSLHQLLLYGIKGIASYADHAWILGRTNDEIPAFLYKALAAMVDSSLSMNDLVEINLECGMINLKTMELLDTAHTERYGHPVPTKVPLGVKKGAAIMISGHDLHDLENLLKQTEGKGITIYTHGEMLPAHGYPELKKYEHLYGNYGGAWQDQKIEFAKFPGAILMTTNCIQEPQGSYKENIFTTGQVAYTGVKHIGNDKDFTPVIERALALGGFEEDKPDKEIMVGFGHNAVLGVADKVIESVKNGDIKHFFLVGGCDGAKSGRNYYTEFAEKAPKDSIILTLACGKFRFNKGEYGDINGIPRLLDVGQCNDAYSAIKIASALADAFGTDVNGLPLSLILSWYEQKAVAILLTLLALGIKNIKLGPSLPAFVSPNVLKLLVENYNIAPVSTVEEDIRESLSR